MMAEARTFTLKRCFTIGATGDNHPDTNRLYFPTDCP